MPLVHVGGDDDLITLEIFRELHADLMGDLGRDIVLWAEGLHDVIVLPSVLLFEFPLDKQELIQRRFGAALDPRDQ